MSLLTRHAAGKRLSYQRRLGIETLEDRRLLTAGDLDTSFDTDGKVLTSRFFDTTDRNEEGRSVAIQSDGKVVVAGFTSNGFDNDFALARYNTNGFIDTSFGGDGKVSTPIGSGNDQIYGVVIQSDGKIVVAGSSFNGSNYDIAIARYLSNGNLDTTFNGTGKLTSPVATFLGDDEAFAIGLQSNGTIVVAGRTQVSASPKTYDFFMARYSTTGTQVGNVVITNTFIGVNDQDDQAYGLAIGPGDSIYVSGYTFSTASNSYEFAVAKYTSNGFLDTSFGGDGKVATNFGGSSQDEAYGIVVHPDGGIVVAGRTRTDGTAQWNFAVARYLTSGTLQAAFDGDGLVVTDFGFNDEAYSVALQSDGSIVVAGITDAISGVGNGDFALARYNKTDGSLDTSFNGDGRVTTSFGSGEDKAFDVAVQSDDRIVAVGFGTITASNHDFAVARYVGLEFPEVTVLGNGINITDGDSSPSPTDGTNFGSVTQGGTGVSRTFTIQNDGSGTLTLSGLTVPAGYTVIDGLAASLAPGASDSLIVRLDTISVGVKSGQISFNTNDTGESPFNFSITGSVTALLLGDYNRDAIVNAGDYVLWRKTMGQSGIPPFSGADGSGNGSVGPEDYTVWRSHFGAPPGAGAGESLESPVTALASSGGATESVEAEAPAVAVATTQADGAGLVLETATVAPPVHVSLARTVSVVSTNSVAVERPELLMLAIHGSSSNSHGAAFEAATDSASDDDASRDSSEEALDSAFAALATML